LPTFSGAPSGDCILLLVPEYGNSWGTRTADATSTGTDGASTAVVRGMVRVVHIDTRRQRRA